VAIISVARNVVADFAPIIDPDDPGPSIALTVLLNLPINLLVVLVLIRISHLMKRNRVYEIEPHRFLPLVLLTVLILTIIGAIIDFYVISSLDVQYDYQTNTSSLTNDPYLLMTGLILIELSFFFAVLFILKQTVLTSLIVGLGVTALNFASWQTLSIASFDSFCVGASVIPLWILTGVIAWGLDRWYEREFHKYLGENVSNDTSFTD
jgi:hypothetical protein